MTARYTPPQRGSIRCDVAKDVADELERFAASREAEARDIRPDTAAKETTRAMLWAEIGAVRTVIYAIRKCNLQL